MVRTVDHRCATRRSGAMRAACLIVPLALSACATLPNGHRWGQDVTASPGWRRVGEAALHAVESPSFWVPLAAAGAFQIDGWDRRLSNWARAHRPVFGTQANAESWSNRLRSVSVGAAWGSVALTPSGPIDATWLLAKVKGGAVTVVAGEFAIEFTSGLKRLTKRERPNGYDNQSMPSDHTATSAVYNELALQNLAVTPMPAAAHTATDVGLNLLDAATAWARVEDGAHYPSDTLVGWAIGDFSGRFFTHAFMGLAPDAPRPSISMGLLPGGAELAMQMRF